MRASVGAVLLALLLLVPADASAQIQTEPTPALESDLRLVRGDDGELVVHGTTLLRLDAGEQLVRTLRLHAPGDRVYDRALERLAERMQLDGPYDTLVDRLQRPPRFSFDGRFATLAIEHEQPVYIHPRALRSWEVGAYARGAWTVSPARSSDVRLSVRSPRLPIVSWQVRVHSEVGELAAVSLLPEAESGTDLRWSFGLLGRPSELCVDLRPDEQLERTFQDNESNWLAQTVAAALTGVAIALLALLWWLSGHAHALWHRLRGRPLAREPRPVDVTQARRRLGRTLAAALVFAAAALVTFAGIVSERTDTLELRMLPALVAFTTLLLLTAWWRRPWLWVAAIAIVAAGGALVHVQATELAHLFDSSVGAVDREEVRAAVAAVVVALRLTPLATHALAAASSAVLPPEGVREWLERHRRRVWLACMVLAVAAVGQWLSLFLPGERDGFTIRDDRFPYDVSRYVSWLPDSLLQQTRPAVALVVVLAVVGLLEASSRSDGTPAFGARRGVAVALAAVFAATVVGPSGFYWDLELPIALVLALPLVLVVSRNRAAELLTDLPRDARSPRGALERGTQTQLLDAAIDHEILDEGLERLETRYLAGELTRDAHAQEVARLRAGRRTLPPPGLAPTDPRRLALALGPDGTWWGNAMAALRIGRWLMIPAVAYYVIVLVTRIDVIVGPNSTALLGVVVGLALELSTWLGGSFAMGALYLYLPGRTGLPKGAALAAVFIASVGLGVLIGDESAGSWTFRALEVTVFFLALGVLLDRETLIEHGLPPWRRLATLYHLSNVRITGGYAATLAAILLGVAQQLLSGQAAEGGQQLIESLPSLVPGG